MCSLPLIARGNGGTMWWTRRVPAHVLFEPFQLPSRCKPYHLGSPRSNVLGHDGTCRCRRYGQDFAALARHPLPGVLHLLDEASVLYTMYFINKPGYIPIPRSGWMMAIRNLLEVIVKGSRQRSCIDGSSGRGGGKRAFEQLELRNVPSTRWRLGGAHVLLCNWHLLAAAQQRTPVAPP